MSYLVITNLSLLYLLAHFLWLPLLAYSEQGWQSLSYDRTRVLSKDVRVASVRSGISYGSHGDTSDTYFSVGQYESRASCQLVRMRYTRDVHAMIVSFAARNI